jgi:rRNA maturation endonuclease Nob1
MGFRDALKKAGDKIESKTGGAVAVSYKKGTKCLKCNKEYPPGTKFCSQCGEALK